MSHKIIDGVAFYPAATYNKTEEQFVSEQSGTGLSKDQLKNAYGQLVVKVVVVKASKKDQSLDNGTGR